MSQPTGFHIRLGWSGWLALVIVLGLILAVATVATVLLLGAFVILLPIVLVAALLYYLFPGLRRPRKPGNTDIIEGEYRIVDPRAIDPRQLERDRSPDEP